MKKAYFGSKLCAKLPLENSPVNSSNICNTCTMMTYIDIVISIVRHSTRQDIELKV